MFQDNTSEEINSMMQESWNAFLQYSESSLKQRAAFMRTIARLLADSSGELISTAMMETALPEARLLNERARTVFQLNSYADACENGAWLEARIDTALPQRNPPKPDIRKMLVPMGPVVVFGSSNFPFAYSTAGGDTACAFAAGCSVIVKAHPAHIKTSSLVADLIRQAVIETKMPEGLFTHVYGTSFEVGEALVKHPLTKAVGFTGSFNGGKQLFDWANQRSEPIPVFAEMGSVNPVFLLPEKLNGSATELAKMLSASITLGVGQFCTNPGLIIALECEGLGEFLSAIGNEITATVPAKMLHTQIAAAYHSKQKTALSQNDVSLIAKATATAGSDYGEATVASVSGEVFLKNHLLQQEVFGPYSMIVKCRDMDEMQSVAASLEGQLTCTVMATEAELQDCEPLIQIIASRCGRIIFNGVPTGVEVCLSMQHGGPYPSTTDARFTSVGADGIKRFARPLARQNWPNHLLPDELKNENPLNIYRTVNDVLTKEKINA